MQITNRKASFNFFLEDRFESGIALKGCEVKSLRAGKASLQDSYVSINKGEIFIYNMFIAPYTNAGYEKLPEKRERKLLLHKKEIKKLIGKTKEKGYTLIPTKVYFKNGFAKVEFALAKGKKLYDKRQSLKDKETKRRIKKFI